MGGKVSFEKVWGSSDHLVDAELGIIFKLRLEASIGYLFCLSVCLQHEILDELASPCPRKKIKLKFSLFSVQNETINLYSFKTK